MGCAKKGAPHFSLLTSHNLLVLQQVADFGEEFLLRRTGGSGRGFRLGFGLSLQLVDALDDQEDGQGDDDEVEDDLQEVAPSQAEGRLDDFSGLVHFLGHDGPLPVGEVESAGDGTDKRHDAWLQHPHPGFPWR